ncbi:hypothetical protein OO007_15665 [Cocleimonas sp. KMM 6892]|uniref:FimV/HubP family polar landmark protein n=1 Tax=unclassified Cocleimonas TaxID=2639732 RepID=UPI002DC00028|nr:MULTISPECIES: FimV/HubP family polar landmark protein [unclassified Cocleimonas]MEB8433676.1 hypothetical protein [Cocleimonas sp. KMM 6892]MEC4716487.1 hypothetical protein [Cocleimonas sp. KMM 6895]MEC4745620.1 hypothetical protein [Cocleimonas sp. KMM 6896]
MISKNKIIYLTLCSFLSLALMSVSFAETRYKVKSTDNLNKIIERYYSQSDLTRSQLLIGLLARNQEAFRGGNINFLLRGKQLILPNESDIETLSDEEAKALLSEHARYFRRGQTGDFGSPIANGYLVNKSKKADVIQNKQELQTIKIDQLEKESDDLRKRLDQLIADKNESDAQLRKVEEALQKTLSKPQAADTDATAASHAQKFEESKKKLDEQAKEKIDIFQSINAEKSQISNAQNQLEVEGKSTNVSANNEASKEAGMKSIMSMLEKYYLPIIAFLLLLFGWMFWVKNKQNRLIADEVNIQPEIEKAYLEEKDFLNVDMEQEPLKDSVKIDMAVAYIDAGDIDSAKDILHKLINEGDSPQRDRAQKLLNTI